MPCQAGIFPCLSRSEAPFNRSPALQQNHSASARAIAGTLDERTPTAFSNLGHLIDREGVALQLAADGHFLAGMLDHFRLIGDFVNLPVVS
jgi:hypothetical protein